MRPPAYLLLPILGTLVLVAVVLGTWLWPEPVVPAHSLPPPAPVAPAVVAPPASPSPAFKPPAPRPVVRTEPARPAPPPEQPVAAVPSPVASEVVPPPPPPAPPSGPPTLHEISPLPPDKQAEVNQMWRDVKERAAEKALESIQQLERQRDDAQQRGDQVEVDRLEQLIMAQREAVEELRGLRPPKSYPSRFAPGVPSEPPRQ